MPTKKPNKRAKQLKKGKRLENTKPLKVPPLARAANTGVHISTVTLAS